MQQEINGKKLSDKKFEILHKFKKIAVCQQIKIDLYAEGLKV